MKKLAILTLIVFANISILMSQEYNIFLFNNKELVKNDNFINSEFWPENILLTFHTKFTTNIERPESEIILYRANESIGIDPGDFEMIEINNPNTNFIYKNANSWSKFEGDLYGFSNQGWYIEVNLDNEKTALIFKGYQYSAGLPELTVILLHGDNLDVVYNKQMKILSIEKEAGVFSMQIQSNTQETIDGVNWTPAITHTIWAEDGVLKFKDN